MSKDFTKVVRLGDVNLGYGSPVSLFCFIKFTDGKLSITGVEGPTYGGGCRGACGQIDMHEWDFTTYAEGWNAPLVSQFRDVWKQWHLNDMKAKCEHQVGPEWASRDVNIYHYCLKPEVSAKQREAKDKALAALNAGKVFGYSGDELFLASLPYSLDNETGVLNENEALYYEPQKPAYPGGKGAVEVKKTRWLKQSEHSAGFLSKACPVCGYKYGSAWLKKEVPEDVLVFLKGLPEADKQPVWI